MGQYQAVQYINNLSARKRGKRVEQGKKKKKLEEIITENFPNLMENINPQINKTKKNKLKQKQKPNYSYPRIC